jgi:Zn-dependent peptidase ImmA (M78 family)/transcriptional regulator with XRE-family HTH domain
MKNIISENIFRLRISHGLTQEEVSEEIEITRANYIKLEKGESTPRSSTLQKISRLYKVKPEDLMQQVEKPNGIRFRIKSINNRKKQTQREQIIQLFSIYLSDYREILELLNSKTEYLLSDEKFNNPKDAALKVRKKLGLREEEPILDICEVLEKIGIHLIFIESSLDEFFGLSKKSDHSNATIGINNHSKISVERKIFTIAHELGHILLHSSSFQSEEKEEIEKEEKEADEFASYFLLPDKGFWNEWHKRKGLPFVDKIIQIKRIYKISYRTVLYRLEETKSIPYKPFAIFNKNYKKKFSKHEEPEGLTTYDFSEEKFPSLIKEAFLQEKISFSRTAELLKISNHQMRELSNFWYMELK